MAPFDFIAEKDIRDERLAFARKLIQARDVVVDFVDRQLGWNGTAEYDGFFKGSFNVSICVKRRDSDGHVLIRFPFPGNIYGPWRDEKVKNEVMAMKYIRQHTSIPVPIVHHWGITEDSPEQLGPFIIMDFMQGEDLGDLLRKPTEDEQETIILDPNIDETTLDTIYEQIAEFMLELSRLEFPKIGAISQDSELDPSRWTVTSRPLTYDMNELVTLGGCSSDYFASKPFDRASDFFTSCAELFKKHLEAQRNISGDYEDLAWSQFVARRCFAELIPTPGMVIDDEGPFRLFCDDLRPTNMLVDPETLKITAVLDLEFTNAMPSQFAYDVPWWLLLKPPGIWIGDGKMEDFLDLFVPRKERFIRAMERVESRSPPRRECLSDRMRDSWDSGRFWFNLASRCSFDVDEIYWEALHREGMGEAMLDSEVLAEKEAFLRRKREQFEKYRAERESDERFAN
ncbi:hypothetical protein ACJ41O_005363 [Fusarium nematophilum]